MNRRDFLVTGSTVFLGSVSLTSISSRVEAVSFSVSSIEDTNPSNTDSILIEFTKFNFKTKYLDYTNQLTIRLHIEVGDQQLGVEENISINKNKDVTIDDISSNPIVVDEINTDLDSLEGQVRIQILQDKVEKSNYTQTFTVKNNKPLQATGGDRSIDIVDQGDNIITENELTSGESLDDYDGIKYRVHIFEQVGTQSFTVDSLEGSDGTVDMLLVGGGGAGGNTAIFSGTGGGGGGAGGLVYKSNYTLSEKTYDVKVGNGGSGNSNHNRGESGDNTEMDSITAYGGGGGASSDGDELSVQSGCLESSPCNGADGGSGGGAGHRAKHGQSIDNQGYRGGKYTDSYTDNSDSWGPTSGGGGAGEPGGDASGDYRSGTEGGDGLYYGDTFGDIFGENGWFAGGGGGGNEGKSGGKGGGGQAAVDVGESGEDGLTNTGGGGGSGSAESPGRSGNGGSGIVLIRYPI